MKEWLVTPCLYEVVKKFEAYYKVNKTEPVLIIGDTGIGKTLFLKIFKKLYEDEHHEKSIAIVEANCAHFGGDNSDSNIARSELFGAEKGYSLNNNKNGLPALVKEANNGVLVLDEIGELHDSVQAMLLTFIETGKFRKLGSSKTEESKVQIIAATNKPEKLRHEFKNRFILFHVPPLYQRRRDILYYWSFKFLDLVKCFYTWELFLLLTYNWNGNVREIERVGTIIEIENKFIKDNPVLAYDMESDKNINPKFLKKSTLSKIIFNESSHITNLNILDILFFNINVKTFSEILKVKTFSEILKKEHKAANLVKVKVLTDIATYAEFCFFEQLGGLQKLENENSDDKDNNGYVHDKEMEKKYDLIVCKQHDKIDLFHQNFLIYCVLFHQNPFENKNLLDLQNNELQQMNWLIDEIIDDDILDETSSLIKKIQFKQLLNSKLSNINIFDLSREELLKYYYQGIIELSGGNKKQASKKAERNYTTFISELKQLGIYQ
ncbi:MAG: sigma 54-interacting transcriptional regulator [Desulfobacterales bacterium]|nr:sigma 54-interacting transcriptional regulator [Desulfobacterales bacterium]